MNSDKLAAHLFAVHEAYAVGAVTPEVCTHAVVQAEVARAVAEASGVLSLDDIGESIEGRPIRALRCGHGERRVLLWSQMHGDEPTGTLALLDVCALLARRRGEEAWVEEMLEEITLVAIPMLNPDGAERRRRETAAQIDLNRDALALATPEARILKMVHQQFQPHFALHLHDQDLSSVGQSPTASALALLAPAMDAKNSLTSGRLRAMSVGALLVAALERFSEGRLATFDDTYEPRAFGDNMQAWGTSTLLLESGHWPGDPAKAHVRRLNFVAILTALRAIGDGTYQEANLELYQGLRPNGKRMFHVVVRGVLLQHPSGWSHRADIGLLLEPRARAAGARAQERRLIVQEVGDLSTHSGLEVIDAQGTVLPVSAVAVEAVLSVQELHAALERGSPS
jgi:hypothetical protein